jgi:hypothetical protein
MVSEELTLDEAVERAAEIKKYNDLFLPKAAAGINKDNATSGQFDTSVGNDAKLE